MNRFSWTTTGYNLFVNKEVQVYHSTLTDQPTQVGTYMVCVQFLFSLQSWCPAQLTPLLSSYDTYGMNSCNDTLGTDILNRSLNGRGRFLSFKDNSKTEQYDDKYSLL